MNKGHLLQFIQCSHCVCFKSGQPAKCLANMSPSKDLAIAMDEVCAVLNSICTASNLDYGLVYIKTFTCCKQSTKTLGVEMSGSPIVY